jgi:polygalacturonase
MATAVVFAIGSDLQGGISNFTVRDCTFDGTECGIRLKSDRARGGVVKGMTYENLKMTNVGIPILIYSAYEDKDKKYRNLENLQPDIAATYPSAPVTKLTPIYEDVTFRNITATTSKDGRAGLVWGLPEAPVGKVTMENVTINSARPFRFLFCQRGYAKKCQSNHPGGRESIP